MFTPEQIKLMQAPLDKATVKKNPRGYSYVEGWHAIAEANRIFGFDGWTRETVDLIENTQPTKNANGNFVVSFRAKVRVMAGDIFRDGTGFGSGIAKDIHDAYEGAIKEAETDAMKRALMTFGNPFGLALYDKEQRNVGSAAPALPSSIEPDAHTARAVKLSEMLIVALRQARTEADLREWAASEAQRIESLPGDLCQAVRDAYKAHVSMLKEMEPAQ